MRLEWLDPSGFRNLASTRLHLAAGTVLVEGANGQGKSNLLEAVAMLGTLRSFRGASPRTVVRHGDRVFRLAGLVRSRRGADLLEQIVEPGPPVRRRLAINGVPTVPAQYLVAWPVFALSPLDRDLVVGPPEARRGYLDRTAFLVEPRAFDDLRRYRRALRQRNSALQRGAPEGELAAWNRTLAVAAGRVVGLRTRVLERLAGRFRECIAMLGPPASPEVLAEYRGDPGIDPSEPQEVLVSEYEKRYHETRVRDRQLGFTGDGPHRHDLRVRVDGRAARDTLSAGQAKAVAVGLRMAAVELAEEAHGEELPVVVDDVDAELDGEALARLIGKLGSQRQVFLSSAHTPLVRPLVCEGQRLEMRGGAWTEALGEMT